MGKKYLLGTQDSNKRVAGAIKSQDIVKEVELLESVRLREDLKSSLQTTSRSSGPRLTTLLMMQI